MPGSVWPDRSIEVQRVGGVPFARVGPDDAASWLERAASEGDPISVRLANAYCVALASRDDDYRQVLCGSGVNFADGSPVAWVMSRKLKLGDRKAYLVRGPSLFVRLLEGSSLKHFFIGATEETLAQIERRFTDVGASGTVAGSYAPPFAPVTDELIADLARRVQSSDAEVVWVGMGTPKQDLVTTSLAAQVGMPCVGVGAAFDFYAGRTVEAPAVLQGSGLEWLYRFVREPRRLFRRYTTGNAYFLAAVARHWGDD